MPPSAGQQQAYTLPPEKYQAAIELNRTLDVLYFVSIAWALLVLALMIRGRLGDRFRRFGVWSVFLMVAITVVAGLPFSIARHALGLAYWLSVESWRVWFLDWTKASLFGIGLTSSMAIAGFALVRRSPRRWWFYGWLLSVVAMIAGTYAMPLVFDPLFHDFKPLAVSRPDLIAPILAVAEKTGQSISPDRIFEMSASDKTRTLNAYMTGVGPTRRIVVWDTTVQHLTAPQIQTVFAHELGHYALNHIPRSIALAAAGLLVVFFLLRNYQPGGYADLPRILFAITLASFLVEPVVNSYSRWQEHEADVYELRIMSTLVPSAGDNSAKVDQIMAEISLDDPAPNPFIEFWLYDHPSTNDRMRFARAWPNR